MGGTAPFGVVLAPPQPCPGAHAGQSPRGLFVGLAVAARPLLTARPEVPELSRLLALSRALRPLSWALCVAVAACVPGAAQMPVVSPAGTLAPGGGSEHAADAAPFAVVHASPQGEAGDRADVSVVFSRPLRALGLAGAEAPAPIRLSPEVPGRWQWVGTHALIFAPAAGRLPAATRFEAEVPAATRALDGSVLGKPHRFAFTTPRPKLVRSSPFDGAEGLEPKTTLTLRFNQPIDPGQLEQATRLVQTAPQRGEAIGFAARRPDPAQTKLLELVPRAPLPVNTQFELQIGAGLRGEEGALTANVPQRVRFRTYGPLVVERVVCDRSTPGGRCAAGGSIGISLSNAVRLRELKRALSVAPAVPIRWDSWREDDDLVSYLDLAAPFQPGKTYTLRVAPGLSDRYGQRLARGWSEAVRFDDLWPTVEIGVSGDTLEASRLAPLTIGAVNVDQYQLTLGALSRAQAVELLPELDSGRRLAKLVQWHGSRAVTPKAATNVLHENRVDVASVLGASRRGVLGIAVTHRERDGDKPRDRQHLRLLQVTDLALSGKISRHGSAVWVTRLSTGAPVSGATVELHRPRGMVRKTTDAHGLVSLSSSELAPNLDEDAGDTRAVLIAEHAGDWTARPVRDYLSPWRLDVPVDPSGKLHTYGLLFTERGLYRPGDQVSLKGILRRETASGNAIPAGATFELALESPEGERVGKRSVRASRFGSFDAVITVPRAGALGTWRASLTGPGIGWVSESFEVAEYRPAEFKVSVESDRPSYVRGDRASWLVRGDYLFGSPMARAEARSSVSRSPTSFSPPGSDAFVTSSALLHDDDEHESLSYATLLSEQKPLDAEGKLGLETTLAMPGQRGPELVTAESEISDVSRQSLASSTSAVVHPASFYVGIEQLSDYFVTAPGTLTPKIVALSTTGARLPGKSVDVELVSRKWSVARRDAGGGRVGSVSRAVDRVVSRCTLTTQATPAGCTLQLTEGGSYFVRASAQDERKNPVSAALSFYGIGPGGAPWRENDRRKLELSPNKQSYSVGETARVLVKNPFPNAEAWVTVERAGVYRSTRMKLMGATPVVEVPITDELLPNAFLSVLVTRGRTRAPVAGGADVGAPDYRLGYVELPIDASARRLTVKLAPSAAETKPGAAVSVDVEVRDAAGKPKAAEVALYAVDEGVLSLIGYRTPDPLPVFTAPRALSVVTLESREALARLGLETLTGSLGLDKGRDGGGGGEQRGARRDFRQSAYVNPVVMTGSNGKARVSFTLPDSLTTYRVMAVAATLDDRYGFGESRIVTSQRLMARPALPRFLRAGDDAQAGVIVSSKGLDATRATVSATVSGVELVGDKSRSIDLPKNGSVEVRFDLRARSAGRAKLRFDVAAGPERDAVEVGREVSVPTVLEAVALYGQTQRAEAQKLGDLSAMRRDTGELSLSLASTALVGLGGGVEQLVEYPYGCTEQLASRLLPLLPLRDLARDFAIALPADTNAIVDKTVAELVARQRGDGGFGMWSESEESSPWVSGYALFALHQAQVRGKKLPAKLLERARSYVRRYLEQLSTDPVTLSTQAFLVDVLAETRAPDVGHMKRLYDQRAALAPFARSLLLHAMAVSKQGEKAWGPLLTELESSIAVDSDVATLKENLGDAYAVLMGSPVRSSAMGLRALLAARPDHPLAAPMARGILRARQGGSFRTTQEAAYALLALDEYRKAQESVSPSYLARVWLSGAELMSRRFEGRSAQAEVHRIGASRLPREPGGLLVFEKQGDGTLFYEARLRYAPRTLPSSPLERGFFVQKTLRQIKPEGLPDALRSLPETSESRLAAGGLVLVDLVVVTPRPRRFVVLDDPLPAGLEAVDARLSTTASWLAVASQGAFADADEWEDELAHGRAFLSSWHRRELRDDRVLFFIDDMAQGMYHYRYLARATTAGKFVVPPTKAEEMYTPEVFGRTGATSVEVR